MNLKVGDIVVFKMYDYFLGEGKIIEYCANLPNHFKILTTEENESFRAGCILYIHREEIIRKLDLKTLLYPL